MHVLQIPSFMDSYLSKQQCGFRKGYSTQYCLLVMLERWKNAVEKDKCFGALLTDWSTAFDCRSRELLIAKLDAYDFDLPALKPIQSYLSNRMSIFVLYSQSQLCQSQKFVIDFLLSWIDKKTRWFNEWGIICFQVFCCYCKLSNKNTLSSKRIMVLYCIINLEQF